MPPRPHLPSELLSHPFKGTDAIAHGLLTPGQLRSQHWLRLLRDVYVHRDVPMTGQQRLTALRLVVSPGRVVSGRTAAWLHGAWTPFPGSPVPLEVTDPLTSNGARVNCLARRRLTLRGQGPGIDSVSVLDRDVVEHDGMAVLSPLRTCFDLIRERSLVEAVVVADAFAYCGALDLTTLTVYVAHRPRWPNVRTARLAVTLANAYARSPGETRLRMVVVLAGLPEPFVNVPLLDGGNLVLGIPDLTVVGPRRNAGLEYDGEYHDVQKQNAKDRRRENALMALGGLPLLRYDKDDVRYGRDAILEQIRRLTGLRATRELDDVDFRRPRPDSPGSHERSRPQPQPLDPS